MPKLNYEKLFLEIRQSSFVSEYCTDEGGRLKLYYATQKDKDAGKPTLVRAVKKAGEGKEILYGTNGRPILEVDLKHGKPYGRAKMFDEKGNRIFPNTYWWYGVEIRNAYDFFSEFEDKEKELIEEEKKAVKQCKDVQEISLIRSHYETLQNKLYAPKKIWHILRFDADMLVPPPDANKRFFSKYFPKER